MEPIFELALDLPPSGSRNRVRELHQQLRAGIVSGRLVPGLRLPASRVLAARVGISRNAVMSAYDTLVSEGYAVTQPGGGTFVATVIARPKHRTAAPPARDGRLPNRKADDPPIINMRPSSDFSDDFVLGVPDTSAFPHSIWGRLAGRAFRQLAKEPVRYLDPQGRQPLREGIAKHVSFARAVSCLADDVMVTSGAQQAFDLISRILIAPGRATVALEDPGYPPLRAIMAAIGAKVIPVPIDDEGLMVERIPKQTNLIFVTPSHQFPLGVPMSMARRAALLSFARDNGAVIVEDDYDGEFRHGGRPLDALQTLDTDQSVFYVGTFSKSLFPALRLGFIVAPAWARPALLAAKQRADWHCAAHPQDTLASFISEGHLARHIRKMRSVYHARCEILLQALDRYAERWLRPIPPDAGIHLAGFTPPNISAPALSHAASKLGIRVDSLDRYAVADSVSDGLAFGFGAIRGDQIEPAVRKLARVATSLSR